MAGTVGCCTPCPETTTVNIPGAPGTTGPAGTDGSDGINAFTITTADFTVPAINDQVTVSGANWSWAAVGENVFITGAGMFQVVSVTTNGLSAVLMYLPYGINVNAGATISAGAQASPGGTQTSSTLLPEISNYNTGGSQALTNSGIQLLASQVTLPDSASYLILARVRLDFVGATTVSSQDVTLKLRETTNGPADVANTTTDAKTGIVTNDDSTFQIIDLPQVVYAAAAGDTIQVFGVIDSVPYIGSVEAVEVSILAIKLF